MRKKMKIFRLLFFITLCLFLKTRAESFEEISYIQRGVHPSMSFTRQQISDYNNDFDEELIINNGRKILFYEYQSENTYVLIDSIVDTNLIWTSGTGNFDQDGLKDLLIGMPGDDEYMHLMILEQIDSTSFFDNLVWQSDTLYRSVYYLSISNNLKGDGIERIYGGGIPEITTPTNGYGWYYFTCTGDNQYEILNTFAESTRVQSAMDIGDIDGNGLTEMVITSPENYLYFFESENLSDTTFIKQDSLTEGGYGSRALLILPDIDRDGTNEIMKYQLNYLDPPNSYAFIIYEDTSGTGVYDTIWRRDFEVDTDYSLVYAGDMDYGDVDGDSLNELVICGGRHIEVWESTGDNQFEMSWEYTDPTYNTIQSHIKCHDFNKNGYDEIIFSGCGQSVGDECTRIFEDSVAVNGIEESHEPCAKNLVPCAVSHELKMQIQNQYIIWNTNTQGTLTVYDISGREVIKEESKASGTHKTDIRHLKNGIYFIKLKENNRTIKEKHFLIR
jgi:hypothetical protein